MKTETQTTKENIREMEKIIQEGLEKGYTRAICKTHKASCQRFLEFFTKTYGEDGFEETEEFDMIIKNKIQDLKQAIKLYDEAGI